MIILRSPFFFMLLRTLDSLGIDPISGDSLVQVFKELPVFRKNPSGIGAVKTT